MQNQFSTCLPGENCDLLTNKNSILLIRYLISIKTGKEIYINVTNLIGGGGPP